MKSQIWYVLLLTCLYHAGQSQTWNPLGSGLNGHVDVIEVYENQIYAGGSFKNAGGIEEADYLARWDGSAWHAVAAGLTGPVTAIAFTENDIYVGGNFSDAGGKSDADYIARWDGSTWHALGSGLNQSVQAIAVRGNEIFIGGFFTDAGGNTDGDHIAMWDGSTWHALGTGIVKFNNGVWTLELDGQDLYAGGDFYSAGGIAARGIARWDGSAWHALGSGFWGDMGVIAIEVDGENMYVGGDGAPHDTFSCGVANWNGEVWLAMNQGLSNCLYGEGAWAIASENGNTYVGGIFNSAGIANTECIAHWDGNSWNALGEPGLSRNPFNYDAIYAIDIHGNDVYVGGGFPKIGGVELTQNIARWGEPTVSNSEINKAANKNALKIFPNPGRDFFSYKIYDSRLGLHTVSIFNGTGELVLSEKRVDPQLDISLLPSGIYFIKVESENKHAISKWIKL